MTRDKLILALDVNNLQQAKGMVDLLIDDVGVFKVGKELFTAVGPEIVRYIKTKGGKVFLDLKYHDIPATVRGACLAACDLKVDMLTVHASGGGEMMKAAVEATQKSSHKVMTLAVTVLTSLDQKIFAEELKYHVSLESQVIHLARLAHEAGISGVIASPWEIKQIRRECGQGFLIVTPGVRPQWSTPGDQKRVMTPQEAIKHGADYIVVGRPITQSADPKKAAQSIIGEMS